MPDGSTDPKGGKCHKSTCGKSHDSWFGKGQKPAAGQHGYSEQDIAKRPFHRKETTLVPMMNVLHDQGAQTSIAHAASYRRERVEQGGYGNGWGKAGQQKSKSFDC